MLAPHFTLKMLVVISNVIFIASFSSHLSVRTGSRFTAASETSMALFGAKKLAPDVQIPIYEYK